MSIWAVRLKSHVELRESDQPPRKVTSTASRKHKEEILIGYDYMPGGIYPRYETVEKVKKMTQITFEGGLLLGSLKPAAFARRAHVSLHIGSMLKVGPDVAKRLLESRKGTRSEHEG